MFSNQIEPNQPERDKFSLKNYPADVSLKKSRVFTQRYISFCWKLPDFESGIWERPPKDWQWGTRQEKFP
jgi:hypothetical protein